MNEFKNRIREIKEHYRSGVDRLGPDFFSCCFKGASSYRRASGFFSSHALTSWLTGLPHFIKDSERQIRLLISPYLSSEDVKALTEATDEEQRKRERQKLADAVILEIVELAKNPEDPHKRLSIFTWLIANNKLEVKFAFPRHTAAANQFHEKYGIFDYPWGDSIAFTGSANETSGGHNLNYESVDVYRSWIPGESERVEQKRKQFDEAWEGKGEGLDVLSPSPEVLKRVKETAPEKDPFLKGYTIKTENEEKRWIHQEEAVEAFLRVKCGILEMATGTGKTRTAIQIINRLISLNEIDGAVITASGTDLLHQWNTELNKHLSRSPSMNIYSHYADKHELGLFAAHPSHSILIISRESLDKLFHALPKSERSRLLILHDEVHGLGSLGSISKAKGEHINFPYRLGLSATPEREYDQTGTDFITEEIGKVIYRFTLEDAIRNGILCEFDYITLSYSLTDADKRRLAKVFSLQSTMEKSGTPLSDQDIATRIAAVYKTAENKIPVFDRFINTRKDVLNGAILFVHTKEFANPLFDIIHKHTSAYSTYFDDDEREKLISFSKNELYCLITCHRIAQGVDIPHLRAVVLFASDRAKLETIQRIGRCLRIDGKNPGKRATVIDFVLSDDSSDNHADSIRARWLAEISQTKRKEDI